MPHQQTTVVEVEAIIIGIAAKEITRTTSKNSVSTAAKKVAEMEVARPIIIMLTIALKALAMISEILFTTPAYFQGGIATNLRPFLRHWMLVETVATMNLLPIQQGATTIISILTARRCPLADLLQMKEKATTTKKNQSPHVWDPWMRHLRPPDVDTI